MKFNSTFYLILIFVVNVCYALTTKTITSVKTIPLSTVTSNTVKLYTTLLRDDAGHGFGTYTFNYSVADAFMTCNPPKGLAGVEKRDIKTSTKIVSTAKTVPNISPSVSTIKSITKQSNTTYPSKQTTYPSKQTTCEPYDYICQNIARANAFEKMTTYGLYSLYTKFGMATRCLVFTMKYPITTTAYTAVTTKTYGPLTTSIEYPVLIDSKTAEVKNEMLEETTGYGYKDSYTHLGYPTTLTIRDQIIDYPPVTCTTEMEYNTKIPYITTKSFATPYYSETINYNHRTYVLKTVDYVTKYTTGSIAVTKCGFATKQPPVIASTTTTSTKQPPVITSTTTTSTKQPPVVTSTTTSTKQPPVITSTTTSTKQPPVITSTTTTSTKQPPVITSTTTTSTKQPPVITSTTTSTKQPPVITSTTTSTKQPPVITSTTTTSTKQPPVITSTTTKTTKCLPITVTVTEKEKITVTEKTTVTVTIQSNPTNTNNSNCAKKWAQCGGIGFNGPTCCESGSVCKELNQYYSQCI